MNVDIKNLHPDTDAASIRVTGPDDSVWIGVGREEDGTVRVRVQNNETGEEFEVVLGEDGVHEIRHGHRLHDLVPCESCEQPVLAYPCEACGFNPYDEE